jgi:hypothetical protein
MADDLPIQSSRMKHYRLIRHTARTLLHLIQAGPDDGKEKAGIEFQLPTDSRIGSHFCDVLIEDAGRESAIHRILRAAELPAGGVVVNGEIGGSPITLTSHATLRLATLLLESLAEAGRRAEQESSAAVVSGKGGRRRVQGKPTTKLLEQLIGVYAIMREKYPTSGPQLGYTVGGPLSRFIKAALACAQEDWPELRYISEGAIRAACRKYAKHVRGNRASKT